MSDGTSTRSDGRELPARDRRSVHKNIDRERTNKRADEVDSTGERGYAISVAPRKDSKNWRREVLPFSYFVAKAENPADHKECGGWLGGGLRGNRRTKASIVSRSLAALDYDQPPAGAWERAEELGVLALLHTTYSSTEEDLRFRAIVPLDRDVTPEEYPRVIAALAARIGSEGLDAGSYQPERFMYWPSVADEHRDAYRWAPVDGPIASVEDLLAEAPDVPEKVRTERAKIKRDPYTIDGAVGAFNRAYSIAEAIETFGIPYEPAGEGLWRPTGSSHDPGVREIAPGLVYSHHANDPAFEQTLSAFDLVRVHLYGILDEDTPEGTKVERLPSTAALTARILDDPRVVEELTGDFEDLGEDLGPYGEVFAASPRLAQIRAAAHSRMVSGPGLLLYVLGRVLAEVPPEVELPAVIGSAASLNLGVAVVAESGGGKSALMEVSRELLGPRGFDQQLIERSPGSGEGMVETYLQTVGRGKSAGKQLIDDPRRIMAVDEIGSLGAVQGRNGATIAPTIRTMLTGGMVGQENASAETRRLLFGGTYRLVLFAGVQPTRSDVLLDDADAGTPQRFVWVPADDETIPPPEQTPEWPGALGWRMPELDDVVDYPDDVKARIRRDRWEQVRGKDSSGLRGHLNLTRLKVAAALAILHEESAIDGRWWEIAGTIVDASMRLQDECRAALSREVERKRRNAGRLDAVRAEGAAEVRDEKLTRAARAVAKLVHRHDREAEAPNRKHAPGEGCTARCVTYAVKHHRELRDEAVSEAEAEDWIRKQDDRWFPGASQPAGDP